MSDETSHILFLKEQVLRFAAAIKHTHKTDDITNINEYAKKNHKSSTTDYGIGDENNFGHVKVDNTTNTNTTSTNPVQNKVIVSYIGEQLNALKSELKNVLQSQLNIIKSGDKLSSKKDDDETDGKYNIPTTKAVWDAIKSYDNVLDGVSLARPKKTQSDINKLITPGYYIKQNIQHFSYGGESINCKNALIKVEKQSNRIIQHVYATSYSTTAKDYKLNGSEYRRWGIASSTEANWKAWHVAHKPYTKTVRACKLGEGVNAGSVVVYENTAGFIIHWDQNNSDNDKYPISAELYEYAKVCEFNPPLPIKGPYVFGNLIGRCDFRITSSKMEIRSNVSKGGRIIGMHETFFVPRNQ